MRRLVVRRESWPIRGTFTISRGSKTAAEVVVVEVREDGRRGRGECVPYPRYDESVAGVVDAIEALRRQVERGLSQADLQEALPPGAARNAIDCALWDLEAKSRGDRVWEIEGLPAPEPTVTAYTLSLDTPERMREEARGQRSRPLLKLKLGGDDDIERVAAVREGAPEARLIVDANEAWTADQLTRLMPELAALGVALVEQPLPAGDDGALADLARPIPVCADESCHDRASLERLGERYDVINIKLDKSGGLTEALDLVAAARSAGLGIMVGCMIGTSLAMAPATLLTPFAAFVDLDGPLLLSRDRRPGLSYEGGTVHPPAAEVWG
jgi:L-alanine-DL-glutamate epimerase-like enolase superfamily enzyme